jgi:hypothetical protein
MPVVLPQVRLSGSVEKAQQGVGSPQGTVLPCHITYFGSHRRSSVILQKNYKDANLREIAREKAKAANAKTEQPKYRDRASERRVMHNQPDIPLPETSSSSSSGNGNGNAAVKSGNGKRRFAEGPPPPASPPPPPINPGEDTQNVGNKLLRMMGWTEGTGLGQDGEGRVEPMYVLTETCFLYNHPDNSHWAPPLPFFLSLSSAKPRFTLRASGSGRAKVKRLESIPKDTLDTCTWLRIR